MSDMSPNQMPSASDFDTERTHRPISLEELHATAAASTVAAKENPVPEQRKPRLALMGEFSAGKSTMTNLLMGCRPLPERVTATRLSPVWISKGEGSPRRVHLDGREDPVPLDLLDSVPIEDTRMIRLFLPNPPILEYCDVIDFPGISDPNMDSEVWERLLPDVDMILWCTHATQAWRQSEAAVWEMVPERVREKSLLMVTRFDKLTTDRDRSRVLNRLRHEALPDFEAMFPICLLQALEAGQTDVEAWNESGAGPFADHLIDSLRSFPQPGAGVADAPEASGEMAAVPAEPQPKIVPRRVRPTTMGERNPRPAAVDPDGPQFRTRPDEDMFDM